MPHSDVAAYLLDRGLLSPQAVVDDELVISDVSRRNRDYKVETRDGPCYMLKQGVTRNGLCSVGHEARVYQRLMEIGDVVSDRVPRFYTYDEDELVLVLELIRDSEDLAAFYAHCDEFPTGPAALLGGLLGTLHRATQPNPGPAWAPWVLLSHRPDVRVFREASAAALEVIRIVQGAAGFAESLESLRRDCRTEALVHGDVKWDNCLILAGAGADEELRLIDWETAAAGDPCWDIGSALSHYVSAWLFSIPVAGVVASERLPALASRPLDGMKPALTACWQAYVDARGLGRASAAEELVRAVRFLAARLLQTAFEAAQMLSHVTSAVILHLQLALNTLLAPEDAATQLLGLPLAGGQTL